MKSHDALHQLERLLAARGMRVDTLSVTDGIEAMLEFYRSVRADDCALEDGGDMLLLQWGTYDWGEGARFELNLTRQVIPIGGEDEDIWQLQLTFRFDPSAIASGNRWCATPAELDDFTRFARSHAAAAKAYGPLHSVALVFEQAG
jgi:hypothetical protein